MICKLQLQSSVSHKSNVTVKDLACKEEIRVWLCDYNTILLFFWTPFVKQYQSIDRSASVQDSKYQTNQGKFVVLFFCFEQEKIKE